MIAFREIFLRSSWRDKMCRSKAKRHSMIVHIGQIKYIIYCLLHKYNNLREEITLVGFKKILIYSGIKNFLIYKN